MRSREESRNAPTREVCPVCRATAPSSASVPMVNRRMIPPEAQVPHGEEDAHGYRDHTACDGEIIGRDPQARQKCGHGIYNALEDFSEPRGEHPSTFSQQRIQIMASYDRYRRRVRQCLHGRKR